MFFILFLLFIKKQMTLSPKAVEAWFHENAGLEGSYHEKCCWLPPIAKYIFLAGKTLSIDGCSLATEENIVLLAGSEERIFFSQDS